MGFNDGRGKEPAYVETQTDGSKAVVDSAGEVVGLTTSQVEALVSGYRKPTCVLLGDSRWAQGYGATALTVGRFQEGAFHHANALSGNRFKVLNDAGIGGNTLADMLARVQTDVIAYAPRYCFIKGGINSLQTQYAGLSASANYAATVADALALITALKNAGIIPVIGTEGSKGGPTASVVAATIAYNDWLRQNAAAMGFLVWDYAALSVDPAPATYETWVPRNVATWWRDGDALSDNTLIHTNNLGAYYEGKLLASLLSYLEPAIPRLPTGPENWTNGTVGLPFANCLDNPGFVLGSGGTHTSSGVTGNLPQGYTLTRTSGSTHTGTCALVNVTDPETGIIIGQAWELTVTAAAANDEWQLASANLVSGSPRAPIGSRVSAAAVVQLITPSNVQHVQLWATADPGGGGQAVWGSTGGGSYSAGGAIQPMVADTWHAETPQYTVPAGVLAQRWQCRLRFLGSGAGTVLRVWAPRYRAT